MKIAICGDDDVASRENILEFLLVEWERLRTPRHLGTSSFILTQRYFVDVSKFLFHSKICLKGARSLSTVMTTNPQIC